MATVKELIERFEFLVKDTVHADIIILLFNECSEDLSDVSGHTTISDAQFLAEYPYLTLPKNYIEMFDLKIKLDSDTEYDEVKPIQSVSTFGLDELKEGSFVFDRIGDVMELKPTPVENGRLLMRYYSHLPRLMTMSEMGNDLHDFNSQTPALKAQYHKVYPLFAAIRYSPEKAQLYEREYQQAKSDLLYELQKQKVRNNQKYVTKTRQWV